SGLRSAAKTSSATAFISAAALNGAIGCLCAVLLKLGDGQTLTAVLDPSVWTNCYGRLGRQQQWLVGWVLGRSDKLRLKIFAGLGGDPARVDVESRPRTTSEDALYTAAVLKPKRTERWLLVTSALHMPRAVGCFRVAGFQVEPYPVEFRTVRSQPSAGLFSSGSEALNDLDRAGKEWIGLIAYRLMGKTDALFPAP